MQDLRTQRLTVRIVISIIEDSQQSRKQNRQFCTKNYFRKNMNDNFVEFYPSKTISCMVQCNSGTGYMNLCSLHFAYKRQCFFVRFLSNNMI